MKTRVWLTVFPIFVAITVLAISRTHSQMSGSGTPASWSITNPTSTANERMLMQQGQNAVGANQVVLVDSTKQVMAVYWIVPDSGVIQLKSVRSIAADLQLEEFNGAEPAPSKVRSILSQPK